MKNNRLITFTAELKDELAKLNNLIEETVKLSKVTKNGGRFGFIDIRTKSSIAHDFYTGIEHVFKKIAVEINGGVPNGEDWHKRLLYQMSVEVKGIRSAVITDETYKMLYKLLGFRHLVRNIYGFELEKERVDEIIGIIKNRGKSIIKEIEKFVDNL